MCFLDKLLNAFILKPTYRDLRSIHSSEALPSSIIEMRKWANEMADKSSATLTRRWNISFINVPIKEGDGTVEVLIHTQNQTGAQDERLPLFLYVHSGGYVFGSHKEQIASEMAETLLKEHGARCVFASVAYRLAPEHPAPAACLDVEAAFEHLLSDAVASRFGYDASRLHLYGVSAGAGLAYAAGASLCRQGFASRIGSIFLDCPMSCPMMDTPSFKRNADTYLPVTFIEWSWDAYAGPDRRAAAADPMICPHGDPDGVTQMKGVYVVLVTCKADPLRDDGIAIKDALTLAGSHVAHWDLPSSHCLHFYVLRQQTKDVYEKLSELLKSTFKRRNA